MTSQCDLHQIHTLQNTGKITIFSEATLHDGLSHGFAVTHSIADVADTYDCALKRCYTQGFRNISFDMPNYSIGTFQSKSVMRWMRTWQLRAVWCQHKTCPQNEPSEVSYSVSRCIGSPPVSSAPCVRGKMLPAVHQKWHLTARWQRCGKCKTSALILL